MAVLNIQSAHDEAVKEATPRWVPAISVPTALLGIVAFFLPWVQISCTLVPLSFSMSGYQMATGSWTNSVDPQRTRTQRSAEGFGFRITRQRDSQIGIPREPRFGPHGNGQAANQSEADVGLGEVSIDLA